MHNLESCKLYYRNAVIIVLDLWFATKSKYIHEYPKEMPLTHATIWKAIKATPEIGLRITHMTNDCVGEIPTIETPTSELSICNFIHI
jgi:hypothetical protein